MPRRRAMALAATASGGETMAPRATAAGQLSPGMTKRATVAGGRRERRNGRGQGDDDLGRWRVVQRLSLPPPVRRALGDERGDPRPTAGGSARAVMSLRRRSSAKGKLVFTMRRS